MMKRCPWVRKTFFVLFWLCLWQTASSLIDNSIVLVGPVTVIKTLFSLIPSKEFWTSILFSFGKISLGFFSAFLLGIALGGASYAFSWIKELLDPVILLMKSIPVASFVILALIWAGSENLSVFISFLVVFPVIYINTLSGLQSADEKLLEMAYVFRMELQAKIRFIYIPALLPYLINGCRIALGMSWKSGIAAEVIGTPSPSIGEQLYYAKVYLSTGELFAWTLVIIGVSALFEWGVLWLLKKLSKQ